MPFRPFRAAGHFFDVITAHGNGYKEGFNKALNDDLEEVDGDAFTQGEEEGDEFVNGGIFARLKAMWAGGEEDDDVEEGEFSLEDDAEHLALTAGASDSAEWDDGSPVPEYEGNEDYEG